MALTNKDYKERLIDKKIERYLKVFGAISIEGPKWCGKTWTSLNHANSKKMLDDENIRNLANLDIKFLFDGESPTLIDEWYLVPKIWDAVRRECDNTTKTGNYILTGSTTLPSKKQKEEVHHSGAGRIARMNMYPMSLYESGDSTGEISITDMLAGIIKNKLFHETSVKELANLIVRGGWPANLNKEAGDIGLIPKSYIDTVLNYDIHSDEDKKRDKNKMKMMIKSLSRNETAIISDKTIVKDIEEYETSEELLASRTTIDDYLDVLDRLHLIENQEAYSENYRSPERIGKSPKRHFTDPSLACACLDLTVDKILNDFKTFEFLFEALVERDLRIYMDYLDGHLYHFRDRITGLEVDSILEFSGGDYEAIEIKLGFNQVEDAKKSLLKFYDNMIKKPKFMCIIVGICPAIIKDPETGIYIVPITALKP